MSNDEQLLHQFENCTLSKEQWTHTAHVRVAYLHLLRHPATAAINKLRAGIQSLNAAQGVVDTPDRGYHETMTQAWVFVIAAILQEQGPAESSEEFLTLHPQLGQSNLLQRYYSKELLMSAAAKVGFVEPNLAPLPRGASPRA